MFIDNVKDHGYRQFWARIPPNVTLWFKYDEAALASWEMWWLLAVVGFLCVCFPCCLFKPWAMCSRTIIANNQMCCSLSVSLTKGCDWRWCTLEWVGPICHKLLSTTVVATQSLCSLLLLPLSFWIAVLVLVLVIIVFFGIFCSFCVIKKIGFKSGNVFKAFQNGNGNSWALIIAVVLRLLFPLCFCFVVYLCNCCVKSPSR